MVKLMSPCCCVESERSLPQDYKADVVRRYERKECNGIRLSAELSCDMSISNDAYQHWFYQ